MDEKEELVAMEHGTHGSLVVGPFGGLFGYLVADFAYGCIAVGLAHVVRETLAHTVCDVFHTHEDGGRQPRIGQLLVLAVGPEAIAQVVVLYGGVLLQLAIAAMVVGGYEALVADNLSGAEMCKRTSVVAQPYDGIFDTALVDAVDVFGREFEAVLLHVGIVLAYKREEPHALIGTHHAWQCQQGTQHDNG